MPGIRASMGRLAIQGLEYQPRLVGVGLFPDKTRLKSVLRNAVCLGCELLLSLA
jgi:hypothetical protein